MTAGRERGIENWRGRERWGVLTLTPPARAPYKTSSKPPIAWDHQPPAPSVQLLRQNGKRFLGFFLQSTRARAGRSLYGGGTLSRGVEVDQTAECDVFISGGGGCFCFRRRAAFCYTRRTMFLFPEDDVLLSP